MAEACRRHAASWAAQAGREALLTTADELEQMADQQATRDRRLFQKLWTAGEVA